MMRSVIFTVTQRHKSAPSTLNSLQKFIYHNY